MIVSYSRISTDRQDLEKSRHLINEYLVKKKLIVDKMIEVQISSRRSLEERRLHELLELPRGSIVIVPELSRLGRHMLETLNLINSLAEREIEIIFIRQPELSTSASGPLKDLLTAIYAYFAETERDYVSLRTKQGLAAAKAKGIRLGRRKGSRNKNQRLSSHKSEILELLKMGVSKSSILKIVNSKIEKPVRYNSLTYFIIREALSK